MIGGTRIVSLMHSGSGTTYRCASAGKAAIALAIFCKQLKATQ
jgi:hypothetical protein